MINQKVILEKTELGFLVSETGINSILLRDYEAYVIQRGGSFAVFSERFDRDCMLLGDKKDYVNHAFEGIYPNESEAFAAAYSFAATRASFLVVGGKHIFEDRT